MTFEEILDQALAMLQCRGRVTYSALKRQFDLDDVFLEDLKEELLYGQRLVREKDGRDLIATGLRVNLASGVLGHWHSYHDLQLWQERRAFSLARRLPLSPHKGREAVRRAITLLRRHRGRGRNHPGFAPGYD
jgi:hypothetical protein